MWGYRPEIDDAEKGVSLWCSPNQHTMTLGPREDRMGGLALPDPLPNPPTYNHTISGEISSLDKLVHIIEMAIHLNEKSEFYQMNIWYNARFVQSEKEAPNPLRLGKQEAEKTDPAIKYKIPYALKKPIVVALTGIPRERSPIGIVYSIEFAPNVTGEMINLFPEWVTAGFVRYTADDIESIRCEQCPAAIFPPVSGIFVYTWKNITLRPLELVKRLEQEYKNQQELTPLISPITEHEVNTRVSVSIEWDDLHSTELTFVSDADERSRPPMQNCDGANDNEFIRWIYKLGQTYQLEVPECLLRLTDGTTFQDLPDGTTFQDLPGLEQDSRQGDLSTERSYNLNTQYDMLQVVQSPVVDPLLRMHKFFSLPSDHPFYAGMINEMARRSEGQLGLYARLLRKKSYPLMILRRVHQNGSEIPQFNLFRNPTEDTVDKFVFLDIPFNEMNTVLAQPPDLLGASALPPLVIQGLRSHHVLTPDYNPPAPQPYRQQRVPKWMLQIEDFSACAMGACVELFAYEHKLVETIFRTKEPALFTIGQDTPGSEATRLQMVEMAFIKTRFALHQAADFIDDWLGGKQGGRRSANVCAEVDGYLNVRAEDPMFLTLRGSYARIALRRFHEWCVRVAAMKLHPSLNREEVKLLEVTTARGVPWSRRAAFGAGRFATALRRISTIFETEHRVLLSAPFVVAQCFNLGTLPEHIQPWKSKPTLIRLALEEAGINSNGLTHSTCARILMLRRGVRIARRVYTWFTTKNANLSVTGMVRRIIETPLCSNISLLSTAGTDILGGAWDAVRVSPVDPARLTTPPAPKPKERALLRAWSTRRIARISDGIDRPVIETAYMGRFGTRIDAMIAPGDEVPSNTLHVEYGQVLVSVGDIISALSRFDGFVQQDEPVDETSGFISVRFADPTGAGWSWPSVPVDSRVKNSYGSVDIPHLTDQLPEIIGYVPGDHEARPTFVSMKFDQPDFEEQKHKSFFQEGITTWDKKNTTDWLWSLMQRQTIYNGSDDLDVHMRDAGDAEDTGPERISLPKRTHDESLIADDLVRSLLWNVDRLVQAASLIEAHTNRTRQPVVTYPIILYTVGTKEKARMLFAAAIAEATINARGTSIHGSVRFIIQIKCPATATEVDKVNARLGDIRVSPTSKQNNSFNIAINGVKELLSHASTQDPVMTLHEVCQICLSYKFTNEDMAELDAAVKKLYYDMDLAERNGDHQSWAHYGTRDRVLAALRRRGADGDIHESVEDATLLRGFQQFQRIPPGYAPPVPIGTNGPSGTSDRHLAVQIPPTISALSLDSTDETVLVSVTAKEHTEPTESQQYESD